MQEPRQESSGEFGRYQCLCAEGFPEACPCREGEVEAMRRVLSSADGTVEPWADHHYRAEACAALRVLFEEGYVLVERPDA